MVINNASHKTVVAIFPFLFIKTYFEESTALTSHPMMKNTPTAMSMFAQDNEPTKPAQLRNGNNRNCIIVTPPHNVVI